MPARLSRRFLVLLASQAVAPGLLSVAYAAPASNPELYSSISSCSTSNCDPDAVSHSATLANTPMADSDEHCDSDEEDHWDNDTDESSGREPRTIDLRDTFGGVDNLQGTPSSLTKLFNRDIDTSRSHSCPVIDCQFENFDKHREPIPHDLTTNTYDLICAVSKNSGCFEGSYLTAETHEDHSSDSPDRYLPEFVLVPALIDLSPGLSGLSDSPSSSNPGSIAIEDLKDHRESLSYTGTTGRLLEGNVSGDSHNLQHAEVDPTGSSSGYAFPAGAHTTRDSLTFTSILPLSTDLVSPVSELVGVPVHSTMTSSLLAHSSSSTSSYTRNWGPGLIELPSSHSGSMTPKSTLFAEPKTVSANHRWVALEAVGGIFALFAVVLGGLGCVMRARASKSKTASQARMRSYNGEWISADFAGRSKKGDDDDMHQNETEKGLLASPAVTDAGLPSSQASESSSVKAKRKDSLESHRRRFSPPMQALAFGTSTTTEAGTPNQGTEKSPGRALVVDGKLSVPKSRAETSAAIDTDRVIDIRPFDLGSRFSVTSTDYPCSENFGSLVSLESLEIVDVELADDVQKFVTFDAADLPRIEEPPPVSLTPVAGVPTVSPHFMAELALMTTPELETTALLGAQALEVDDGTAKDSRSLGSAFLAGPVSEENCGTPKRRATISLTPLPIIADDSSSKRLSVPVSVCFSSTDSESDRGSTSECRPLSCAETVTSRYPSSRFTRGAESEWDIVATYARRSQGNKSVVSRPNTMFVTPSHTQASIGLGVSVATPNGGSAVDAQRVSITLDGGPDTDDELGDARGSAYTMYRRSDWQLPV